MESMYVAIYSNGVSSYIPLSQFMAATSTQNVQFASLATAQGAIVPGPSLQAYSVTAATLAATAANTVTASTALSAIEARIAVLEGHGLGEFGPEFTPDFD